MDYDNTPSMKLSFKTYKIYLVDDRIGLRLLKRLPDRVQVEHDATVYLIATTIPYEDFALTDKGLFQKPGDWLSFAKRIKAEVVEPSDQQVQGEFIICKNCNTMFVDEDTCPECTIPVVLPKGF